MNEQQVKAQAAHQVEMERTPVSNTLRVPEPEPGDVSWEDAPEPSGPEPDASVSAFELSPWEEAVLAVAEKARQVLTDAPITEAVEGISGGPARVDGSQAYVISVQGEERLVLKSCDCGDQPWCIHETAFALALRATERIKEARDVAPLELSPEAPELPRMELQEGPRGMQRNLLEEPFTGHQVRHRQGHGGQQLAYIAGHDVIKRLNDAFDGFWDFEIVEVTYDALCVARGEACFSGECGNARPGVSLIIGEICNGQKG